MRLFLVLLGAFGRQAFRLTKGRRRSRFLGANRAHPIDQRSAEEQGIGWQTHMGNVGSNESIRAIVI